MLKLIHRKISQIIINSYCMPNSNEIGYSYSGGSPLWVHRRLTWERFKLSLCPGQAPD